MASPSRGSPPISTMWAMLQKENRLPKNDVMSSCESEMQELMRQIDLMVYAKKSSWEKEKHSLLARCKLLEQEQLIQKATLQDRNAEVEQMREQLNAGEQQRRDMAAEYEKQLGSLRNEVARLKHEYERLHKKHSRHNKDIQRDRNKASTQIEDYTAEVNRLNTKLEEQRIKGREMEQAKRSVQKQFEAAEAQRKTLSEKCLFLQQQANNYQGELDKRTELLGSTEMTLHNQITQLEGQLHRARDNINSQDVQLSRLKSSLDDALSAQKVALQEREARETELAKAQQATRKSEEEKDEMAQKVQKVEDEIRLMKEQRTKMQGEISRLQGELQERETSIRQLKESKTSGGGGGDQSSRVQELETLLQESHNDSRKAKKNEKYLREEIEEQRQQIETLEHTLLTSQHQQSSHLSMQITQLNEQVEELRRHHSTELEEVKAAASKLSSQLQHKSRSLSAHREQASGMQQALREAEETQERKQAELTVLSAQLEALRVENKHLRRAALGKGSSAAGDGGDDGPQDVFQAEKHLHQLQAAYTQSVNTLEKHNERLKSEHQELRGELKAMREQSEREVQQTRSQSQHQLQDAKEKEERRVREVQQQANRRVQEAEERLSSTVTRYETQLEQLQDNVADTMGSHSNAVKRMVMENAVMSDFVDGVDTIVNQQQPLSQQQQQRQNGRSSMGFDDISPYSTTPESFLNEDFLVDSADLATAEFIAEQNERTRELHQKLDSRIEELKSSSQATIRKYTRHS